MKAIRFQFSLPRYALGITLGRLFPEMLWSGLSCTVYGENPQPTLPNSDWVLIKTRYGGICGSDIGAITLHLSPYYSTLASFPYIIGHENTGCISAVGAGAGDWRQGERVVIEPLLWCEPRGLKTLCPFCERGEINRCECITEGSLAVGQFIGGCRDTGGSWGEYFAAHKSQVYRVPEVLSDENALMVEPAAVGLHAALRHFPADGERVLIIGAGTIGLCTLAGLRAMGSRAEIHVLARHQFQAEAARRLGASQVISGSRNGDYFTEIAKLTGARLFKPVIGRRVVIGGMDSVIDCVGSDRSLDDAIRLARGGGKVTLVAVPGISREVDWTAAFTKELNIETAYCYNHAEEFEGKKWRTFDLALHLMETGKLDLGWMVTHHFHLEEYKHALQLHRRRGREHLFKGVFEFDR